MAASFSSIIRERAAVVKGKFLYNLINYSVKDWKDNISFILVEPKEAGNIGASARAMKNMGFKNLELINPVEFLNDEGRQMACNDADVLEKATVHKNFGDAIKDKGIVIGATRRLGKRRGLILPVRDAVKKIISAARKNKVAILFGRESKGLSNKEVEECGFMITIPADPLSPSLNLSQGVLLVAYELGRKEYKAASPELVKREQLDMLYRRIHSALRLLEYIPRGNRDLETRIMRNLKHLIGRAGLTDWELRMLYGICSQVEKKIY
ncbi:MAG: RNA methyltransferase [Nitrospirae bacterium]|nr:MAG: RNA methyltransferase [Nitrospirota bacterium]